MHFSAFVSWSLSVAAVVNAAVCVQDAIYKDTLDIQRNGASSGIDYCGAGLYKGFSDKAYVASIASACSCIPTPTPVPTRTGPIACGVTGLTQDYVNTALKHHNIHRANHSSQFVTWDCNLAKYAKTWADQCTWAHNIAIGTEHYGQCMAAGADIGSSITDQFYNSEQPNMVPYYGKPDPGLAFFDTVKQVGHFTQVVWNSSTRVGCYTTECPNGLKGLGARRVTVCNYGPAGNIMGQFNTNVFRPGRLPTIRGDYVFPNNTYLKV